MPKTAIPGSKEDPTADPFDLWNGATPGQQDDVVEGGQTDPAVGASPPPAMPTPPPAPRPPEDPYMTTQPVATPQASGVTSTTAPSGVVGPFTGQMPLGDPYMPNPQVGPPAVPLGDPNQAPPQIGGQATLGNPNMPSPQVGGQATLGDPGAPAPLPGYGDQPVDLDRVLLTYLLSNGGM